MASKQRTDSALAEQYRLDSRVAVCLGLEDFQKARHLRKYLAEYSLSKIVSVWFGPTNRDNPDPALVVTALSNTVLKKLRNFYDSRTDIITGLETKRTQNLKIISAFIAGEFHLDDETKHLLDIFHTERPLNTQFRLEALGTRAKLLSWVFGPGDAISRDLLYVKMPSVEKRRLVRTLANAVRRRYRWISPKIIHAVAFRPNSFSNLDNRTKSDFGENLKNWGPLYHRATIPKSKGKRYLWIPNPPLKRIQKSLLRLIGPGIEQALPDRVYGVRIGQKAPMFHNARTHAQSDLVASFDIKDFFPSTHIKDILNGFHYCESKEIAMIEPGLLRGKLENLNLPRTAWSHDAKVLIARLATYRGRLPQGSPLSPLLANIAFAPYDKKIIQSLENLFGESGFQYTRYFDDLTISISNKIAKENEINAPNKWQQLCSDFIERALVHSNYQLQNRKSRSALVKSGEHKVTGLLIRPNEVRLPRKMQRHLRLTNNHLITKTFIEAAENWHDRDGGLLPEFKTPLRGHRWQSKGLIKNRLSAERLACMMLRKTCPDLMVQRLLDNWYPWQEHYPNAKTLEGRPAWTIVERILATLWKNKLKVTAKDDKIMSVTFAQDGVDVCEFISSGPQLDFFFLPFEKAIATVQFWHHLKGMHGFLNAVPEQNTFSTIHNRRDELDDLIERIEIKAPPSVLTIEPQEEIGPPDTIDRHINEKAANIIHHVEQLCEWLNDPPRQLGIHSEPFCVVARDEGALKSWISAAHDIFVEGLPDTANPESGAPFKPARHLFDYVRMKHWEHEGLISGRYQHVHSFEKEHAREKNEPVPTDVFQLRMLEILEAFFTELQKEKLKDPEHWKKHLTTNRWQVPLAEQLANGYKEFNRVYEKLRTTDSRLGFFTKRAALNICLDEFKTIKVSSNDTSSGYWDKLTKFGDFLDSCTRKSIDLKNWPKNDQLSPHETRCGGRSTSDVKRDAIWGHQSSSNRDDDPITFQIIKALRNQHANTEETDEKRDGWVYLQKKVAKLLKQKPANAPQAKKGPYSADSDLLLTGYEHALVKCEILSGLTKTLRSIDDNWDKWPKKLQSIKEHMATNPESKKD